MYAKIAIAGVAAFLAALPDPASAQVNGVTPLSVTAEPLSNKQPLGLPSPMPGGQRSMIGPAGIPLGATGLHTPGESPLMPGLPLNMTAHLLPNNASQGSSVGPARIPLGATELGNLGVSPPARVGAASLTLVPGGSEACAILGTSSSTPLFDGGGLPGSGGTFGGACPASSTGTLGSLFSERSGAVRYPPSGGSAGIAMGADELQNPGLSPAQAGSLSLTTPLATPSQFSPSQ